jgi:NitT/TauT family transport system permease protein
MAESALGLESGAVRRTPGPVRWYQENTAVARALISFVVVGAVWQLAALSGRWPLVLVPIGEILESGAKLWASGKLQTHITVSLYEFAVGYAIAAALGVVVGLILATNQVAYDFVDPWISAIYATPTIALAPFFIFMFGIDVQSKMAVVLLLSFFPIVINTTTGVRSTERVYIEAARSFCASRSQIFRKVLLPSALPFIVAGLRLGVGRGLIGVVVGELFGARAGLGYLIFTSSQQFDTAGVWLGVVILAGTGILSVVLIQKLERRLAPWRQFELK